MIMKMEVSTSVPFFGIPLWALLLVTSIVAFIVVTWVILCFCFICYPRKKPYKPRFSLPKSIACKHHSGDFSSSSLDKTLLLASGNVSEHVINFDKFSSDHDHDHDHELVQHGQFCPLVDGITEDGYLKGLELSGELCSTANDESKACYFSLSEIEKATHGFHNNSLIGSGDTGIVYYGSLPNNEPVAVKRLVCDCLRPVEFFASQVAEIERVKHDKLVKLVGYCAEGVYRILVSEFVENKTLYHWLHEFPEEISSLTWDMRMNIIHGVAEGLAYLHEEVKPMIYHGSLRSTNILLDNENNPKIADFGHLKLISLEGSGIIPEASSYVTPYCHSIETLGNDIYDFGLLIMEIVSGLIPYQNDQPRIVDRFKIAICNGYMDDVLDPRLNRFPPYKVLQRLVLVALRCVDPDVSSTLEMGDVVRMLETNLLLSEEHEIAMRSYPLGHYAQNQQN